MTDISVALFAFLGFVYALFKFLKLWDETRTPTLYYNDKDESGFVTKILKECPLFYQKYEPPLLWGRNGHLHTFVFAKLCPKVDLKPTSRHSVKLVDNSTVIFDIFEPQNTEFNNPNYTIVVVPGIANSSDCSYVLSFCQNAMEEGFRVVVLNHLGVLPVKLTSKRIFTYGSTCELKAMVNFVLTKYPGTKLIGLGFSLGGNIMVKYLGEDVGHQAKFVCGISVCQGYDITKACPALQQWDGLRRCYNWLLTQKVKQVITQNWSELTENRHPHQSRKNKIMTASSLQEIDEHFIRKMAGYQTVTDYYHHNSCSKYINNIKIPMFFINSEDDPIVPECLLEVPKNFATRENNNSIFLLTQYGGHLGFYEGDLLCRKTTTWLNKALLQYICAVGKIAEEGKAAGPCDR